MKKKIVSVCLVVCLLATAIIGTTLAYFTDEKAVTNTFTTGDVTIKLDETDVDTDGVATGDGRKEEGNEYHLLPGKTYTKDPKVTVHAGSEDCYLFVKVVNGLADLEAAGDTTIAKQMENNGWTSVSGVANVYVYTGEGADPAVVNGGASLGVFETFTIDTAETAGTLAEADEVVITAYAIQAEGMSEKTAVELWTAGGWD